MVSLVDPFELPDWLGVEPVTWVGETSLDNEHHLVRGSLSAASGTLACDVLACDLAYPRPVLGEQWRADAHHAWVRGEVLLVHDQDRLTLAAPGASVTAELVLEGVRRLAKAVGAPTDRFTVALRL